MDIKAEPMAIMLTLMSLNEYGESSTHTPTRHGEDEIIRKYRSIVLCQGSLLQL